MYGTIVGEQWDDDIGVYYDIGSAIATLGPLLNQKIEHIEQQMIPRSELQTQVLVYEIPNIRALRHSLPPPLMPF